MTQLAKLKVYLDSISTGDQNADKHLSRVKRLLLRYKEKEFGLKKNSFLDIRLTDEELGTVPDAKEGIGFTISSMRSRDDEVQEEGAQTGLGSDTVRAIGGQPLMAPNQVVMNHANQQMQRPGYVYHPGLAMGPGVPQNVMDKHSHIPNGHMKRQRDGMESGDETEYIEDGYDDDDLDEQDPKRVRRRPGRPPKTDTPYRQMQPGGGMHGRAGPVGYGLLPHQQHAFMMQQQGMAPQETQGLHGSGPPGNEGGGELMTEDEQMAQIAQVQLGALRQIFLQRGQDPMEADRQLTDGLPLQEQTEFESVIKTIGEPIIQRNGAQIHPTDARLLVQRADMMMREQMLQRQQQFQQQSSDVQTQQRASQPNLPRTEHTGGEVATVGAGDIPAQGAAKEEAVSQHLLEGHSEKETQLTDPIN
eukprot:GHVN01034971.1.p1 GENE.GHVN01034971.1~~GHVN01034971.1.p1  ORF type:complete len:471 (-),score=76.43 GHVN01034971.1:3673-4923(-)